MEEKNNKKNKIGRPTKYREEYCERVIEFFSGERYKVTGENDGKLSKTANDLPTFERFASSIDVHVDTLHEWKKVHPSFSESYKKAQQLQKDFLITNALLGLYNNTFSIFLAKNITDLRDKVENHNYNYQDVDVPQRESREEWEEKNG